MALPDQHMNVQNHSSMAIAFLDPEFDFEKSYRTKLVILMGDDVEYREVIIIKVKAFIQSFIALNILFTKTFFDELMLNFNRFFNILI